MENKAQHTLPHSIGLLQTVPGIFKNFSPENLRGILETARYETLEEGIKLNPPKDHQPFEGYLIIEGRLAAMRRGATVEIFESGDFVSEAFLHSRAFVECDLITLDECVIMTFDRESTLHFFRDKPEKLFKIFTINVVEAQQKHICSLYKRLSDNISKDSEL
jgi:hypothetical protein